MNRLRKHILLGVGGVVLLAIVFSSILRKKSSASRPHEIAAPTSLAFLNLAAEVEYVGDEECATCHSPIYRTFKQTGMGRSFYRPTPENVIEDYGGNNRVIDPRSGLSYQMYRQGGDFYQLEYRLDENDRIVHGLGRKVDYIIGSGNHNRTYITGENGFLFEMPVTWYSEKKIWDLSPGYHGRNLRFSRPIAPECMNCHNSYAEHVEPSENRYRAIPMGIGCERCHGPGELHVDKWYRSKGGKRLDDDKTDSTIVNPRRLPVDLQMDVCRQCHLQGDMSVLKEGKKETAFRPGMRLRDVKSVYIRDQVPAGDFRIASHGARISLSGCFTESGGRLVCTFCHNPHEPVQTVARSFFNRKCLDCHALSALTPTGKNVDHRDLADCVACHMRQGATSDILHVNFTDHWIRKEIKSLSTIAADSLLRQDDGQAIVLRDFFDEQDSAAGLRLGIAYVKYFESRHGNASYLNRAVPLLEDGLRRQPEHQRGLYHLAMAYLHLRRFEDAEEKFKSLISLAPEHALAHFQLGEVLQKLGRHDEAIASYRESLSIFPDNAKAQNNLGNILAALGKTDDAVAAYQRALQIQPSYATAYNNLGDLYFYTRHDADAARKCFEKALRLDPNFAAALHNLGNVYLRAGDEEQALKSFQQALEIEPGLAAAHGNLALIYQRQGRREEAIHHLRKVLDIDPDDARARDLLRRLGASAESHM
jgi:tetratricopeptide (TPR) repeat protein